jgi:Transglutaminase-like superfamily
LDAMATEVVRLVQDKGAAGTVATLAARHGQPIEAVEADVERVISTIRQSSVAPTARGRHPSLKGSAGVARAWLRLPLSRKVAAAYATVLVVAVEVLIHMSSVDQASQWLRVPLAGSADVDDPPALDASSLSARERELLGALASVQRRWLFDATCLRRALASGWVLRRHHPRLCLGLAGSDEALAHAWLIVDGHALDGLPGATLFRPLALTEPHGAG